MKGNMFLGYARGSVGDVVFTRQKGQQVGRARNRQPANPRTQKQTDQRSIFANAVKFHSKGVQQLFKFAFEDKKAAESDYNAFMRHNINSSIMISKQASESALYPAIGAWQMSSGSLISANVERVSGSATALWSFKCPSATSNISKWGEFSKCLKSDFGLMEGDIITVVHIIAVGATALNMPAIEPASELQGDNWYISQYVVSEESVADVPKPFDVDAGMVVLDYQDAATNDYAQGVAVIFSRPTAQGLRVSTSHLVPNSVAEFILDGCTLDRYKELVRKSWNTQDLALLQGRLIKPEELPSNIVTSISPTLPSRATEITVNLSRDSFLSDVDISELVGTVYVDAHPMDLYVNGTGSSISLETSDGSISAYGMRNEGAKFTFVNNGGKRITSIVIFDM